MVLDGDAGVVLVGLNAFFGFSLEDDTLSLVTDSDPLALVIDVQAVPVLMGHADSLSSDSVALTVSAVARRRRTSIGPGVAWLEGSTALFVHVG